MAANKYSLAGFRRLASGHYETICGRFDIHRLWPNGRFYVFDNADSSAGLAVLDDFPSRHEAVAAVRRLLGYVAACS